MKKLYLLKNSDLFQGEKNLTTNKYYFEGWYFKNSNSRESISFIPGICIDSNKKEAFIQIITNESSYYVSYPLEKFSFSNNPFYIRVADSYFSKEYINININDESQNIFMEGYLIYSDSNNIISHITSPNIMGPFSYVPFMECNHAIISMKNCINGNLRINNQIISFNDGIGYIEKDWGYTFPKTYIWCQGNDFQNQDASFMCSIADIDFKLFHFRGLICVLIVDSKEYKFTTYNFSKIVEYKKTSDYVDIVLKRGKYRLTVRSYFGNNCNLVAPVNGKMDKDILESICSTIYITLEQNNEVIFSDVSTNCGLEIV